MKDAETSATMPAAPAEAPVRAEKKAAKPKFAKTERTPVQPPDPAALIEVQHLTKCYGDLVVLDDISEKTGHGEKVRPSSGLLAAAKALSCAVSTSWKTRRTATSFLKGTTSAT